MNRKFISSEYVLGEFVDADENSEGWDYCRKLNSTVKSIACKNAKPYRVRTFSGEIYKSIHNGIQMTYKDSDYGNDSYFIEIHESIWNLLPEECATLANENGWNLVYGALDKGYCMKVCANIPGSWLSLVERQARSI